MGERLVLIKHADYVAGLNKISKEGFERAKSICPYLRDIIKNRCPQFFSSGKRNALDTLIAIADNLEIELSLKTRHALLSDSWLQYKKFYEEIKGDFLDISIAIGHSYIVEEFPKFLEESEGGWSGQHALDRRLCQGYVYDLEKKSWRLFPEDFKAV